MANIYKTVVIQDRNGKILGTLEKVPKEETVEAFKKIVNKDIPAISKDFYVELCREKKYKHP